ncbi:MAG: nucleotidyltransferase family protein [Gaiellaceae bacterium]
MQDRLRTPALVGVTLALDAVAVEVVSAFEADGVPYLLLKGPAIGRWLYDAPGERSYDDIDVLVRESDLVAAEETVTRLGFRFVHDDWHGRVWLRGPVNLDLHRRVPGIGADPTLVFDRLNDDAEPLQLGRGTVRVPSAEARALHLGLHAAQHGPGLTHPLEDLRRGLERLPDSVWSGASDLGSEFGVQPVFASGLDLLPAGRDLCKRLGLEPGMRIENPGITAGLRRFAATPGFAQKAGLVVREVFPTRDYLRAHIPLARRGRLGVALARAWRPVSLLLRLGPALVAVARSRGRRLD